MGPFRIKEILNKLWVGLAVSILMPIGIYFIFVHPNYKGFSFTGAQYNHMMALLLPLLVSRCIFPNVGLFFLFIWKEMYYAAKGVLFASMGIAGLLLILKLVARQI